MDEQLQSLLKERDELLQWSQDNGFIEGWGIGFNRYLKVTADIEAIAPGYLNQIDAIKAFQEAATRTSGVLSNMAKISIAASNEVIRFIEAVEKSKAS